MALPQMGTTRNNNLIRSMQSNLPASLNPQKILHQSAPHTAKHLNHKVPQSLWSVTRHAKQLSPQPRHNRLNQDMLSLDNSHKYNSNHMSFSRGGTSPKRDLWECHLSPWFCAGFTWRIFAGSPTNRKAVQLANEKTQKKYTKPKHMLNYTISSCSQLHCQNIHVYIHLNMIMKYHAFCVSRHDM